MPLPSDVDVIVIGAGPAGSTFATLLSKYRPGTRVLVLEKTLTPRFKLGESLLVDVNRVLFDMGALDAVAAAGFPRKYGATFVWGSERTPKTFLWDDGASLAQARDDYHLNYTFHVDRPVYDNILLSRARECGVQIEQGQDVRSLIWEDGRAVGVTTRDRHGVEHRVRARYVIDCAGGQGPLTREVTGRRDDAVLQNIAVHGYYKNVTLVPDITGSEVERRTAIVTTPKGWVWMIPVSNGITSVGFVTSVDEYTSSGSHGTTAFHEDMLRGLPEYDALFSQAELVDYRQDGKMIHAVREYSYSCDHLWGPGWATVGDASGFVDAILSIGVFVAQNHAQFLAHALASVLDGSCDETVAFDSYETTADENLKAFRGVAHCFYAYNPDMTVWWRECAERLKASRLVPGDDDRTAFVAYFSGFAARQGSTYEDALEAFGSTFVVEVSQSLFSADPFPRSAFESQQQQARTMLANDPVLRFTGPYTQRPFALPAAGGRLRPVTRLEMDVPSFDDRETFARRIYLPLEHAALAEHIDGTRPVSALIAAFGQANPGLDKDSQRREVMTLVQRLAAMGAIENAALSSQSSEGHRHGLGA